MNPALRRQILIFSVDWPERSMWSSVYKVQIYNACRCSTTVQQTSRSVCVHIALSPKVSLHKLASTIQRSLTVDKCPSLEQRSSKFDMSNFDDRLVQRTQCMEYRKNSRLKLALCSEWETFVSTVRESVANQMSLPYAWQIRN